MKILTVPKMALNLIPNASSKNMPGVIVAITCPDDEHGKVLDTWDEERILRLEFDDITELFEYKRPLILFNEDHARKILQHIIRWEPAWAVISCDAGVSRSGAVALGLEHIFNRRDMFKKYLAHNWYVYRILLNTWYEKFV
jgi:predicted protein tyrosine phosphatase